MLENNITIMKYRVGMRYYFEVLDKHDEADEAFRLDMMLDISQSYAEKYGDDYEQLWIKNTPII